MRRLFVLIGAVTLALSASGMLWADSAFADASTNYQLFSDNQNQATANTATATSYRMKQSAVTWKAINLTSTSYQLVDPSFDGGGVSSSSSSSSTSSVSSSVGGGTSGGSGGGGSVPNTGRRPRPESSSSVSSSAAVSSAGASSSASSIADEEITEEPVSSSVSSSVSSPLYGAAPSKKPTVHRASIDLCSMIGGHCPLLLHGAAKDRFDWVPVLLTIILSLGWGRIFCRRRCTKQDKQKRSKKGIAMAILVAFLLGMTSMHTEKAYAVQTTPLKHVYNGRLLDASGNPVTSAQSIRFSYWTSTDYVTGDVDGSGNINTGASTYANWTEVHTVTPSNNGYFSVNMGSVTSLPNFANIPIATLLSLYLQVEVKPQASANTAYELLDIDPTDTSVDRSGVLSVPFSLNADMIDQREIGTSSGSIAILGPGGKFGVGTIPGGTNEGTFTIDSDNTEVNSITLQFGSALNKKLTYDIVNSIFRFNANVEIQGNLTVTGLVNGVNITQLQSSTGALKASSGGGLSLNVSYGNYRLNGIVTNYAGGSITMAPSATNYVFFGSGGLTKSSLGFPVDESMIPVAIVTTSAGSITSITDRRVLSSDDREHNRTTVFTPAFEKATYQGDGGDNIGQLSTSHDNTNLQNFYLWTSTKPTLQDYDILLRIPVSENFVRWQNSATANAISLAYRSTSASSAINKLDIQVYDTAGVPVTLSGATTNLASTSWQTTQIEFTGTPTWTPGQDILMRLKVSAKDNFQMHIGTLKLNTVTFNE